MSHWLLSNACPSTRPHCWPCNVLYWHLTTFYNHCNYWFGRAAQIIIFRTYKDEWFVRVALLVLAPYVLAPCLQKKNTSSCHTSVLSDSEVARANCHAPLTRPPPSHPPSLLTHGVINCNPVQPMAFCNKWNSTRPCCNSSSCSSTSSIYLPIFGCRGHILSDQYAPAF